MYSKSGFLSLPKVNLSSSQCYCHWIITHSGSNPNTFLCQPNLREDNSEAGIHAVCWHARPNIVRFWWRLIYLKAGRKTQLFSVFLHFDICLTIRLLKSLRYPSSVPYQRVSWQVSAQLCQTPNLAVSYVWCSQDIFSNG